MPHRKEQVTDQMVKFVARTMEEEDMSARRSTRRSAICEARQ